MNWVDFIILLIVSLFAAEGIKRGFFNQIFNILGFIFSLVLALGLYPYAADLLISLFNLPPIAANPIGFLIVWLTAETIFFTLIRIFLKKYLSYFESDKINKYLGFLPAALNALLFLAFVLLFVVSLPIRPDIKRDIYDSKVGSYLVNRVTALEKPLNSVFGPITKQGLTFLTIRPEDKGAIDLQFTQNVLTVDFASEQEMFRLVNEERVRNGTKPLVWDESLARVGRQHSQDMFQRGYFSHFSPEGKDVGDRLLESGIEYSLAGENLALAPNVERAHIGLINSEGHRRNILDPAFGKIGIGAVDGGVYGKMFTQVFTE
ncbi:hypothetical protein A3J17_02220 [Candidatus Curtissbacteria bacterium RIFCSPLOWO2_02_FULL_40_11]|uniref:SCP domain-containing protein n=2 Tax=Candidatus Curtissiibacteriota TaxID=1752717 RepID=A0A1F5G828_9BACT|nr:MAG: hypothetical protein A3D04_02965 [Candidatus Curtissbacteria bacterium RIFCSPHIGHO2_02_FULL_40_16b]OGD90191.1 MAG: hypothetical protein A3E11_00540 [Candidatus Curtissbacteria bacterium RIFCSPHIGHO2_12_FULL_38_37]OGE00789.1 MAG: hypothetical protein A3J17_02220 [Candidatus Curtissbacteria bacterium RIFCSPLOWO2_02_FULL_40_11]OGE14275.1 MAG: hypothetical protein A3G14_04520 [Candidatus Curtissbacteria bacterium RIFCSPLOWO2_12_FULL_38_9]